MVRKEILNEAERCVCTDREQSYGSPEDNFGIIAKLWSVYLDKEIHPADVAWMMILLKIARCKSGQFKDDNAIDICGYAACGGEIMGNDLVPPPLHGTAKVDKGCEYCRGTVFTPEPFAVETARGEKRDVLFNFCPNCGRTLQFFEE